MGATKTILLEELEREQIERERDEDAAAEARNHALPVGRWIAALDHVPHTPRCVLATDGEAFFIAVYWNKQWTNAWTEEDIYSATTITHWMELPEVPIV